MEKNCGEKRWEVINSAVEEDDDEEEALSLSDLPLIHNSRSSEESCYNRDKYKGPQEDFDFCSLSKEHEMCAADDVFFQGQILPLRHSVSSEKGLLLQYSGSRSSISRSISRSESMDHYYSGGFMSSRSSSISSHQSSSSGGSAAAIPPKYKPKLNQFHSHPSPSPRIHFPTNRQTNHRYYTKKSSLWNVIRLGLVTGPPEVAFQDLKTRCPSNNSTNCKNFGSRNSTSSNSSSISITSPNKTKKRRGFLGGCKCTADVVDKVASRVVIIKRSASESDAELAIQVEEESVSAKMTEKRAAKKQLSHHRTFEWLKQLSLEGPAEEA